MSDIEKLGTGEPGTPKKPVEAAPAGKSGGGSSLKKWLLLFGLGLPLTVGGTVWLTWTKLVPRLQGTALEAKVREFKVQRIIAAEKKALEQAIADSIELLLAQADTDGVAEASPSAEEKPKEPEKPQVPTYTIERFVAMTSGPLGDREVPFDIVVESGTEAAIEELAELESDVRAELDAYFQGRTLQQLLSMLSVQAKDSVRTLLNGLLSAETPVDTVYFLQ